MDTYVRKSQTIQARENTQAGLTIISARKGQQRAAVGDYLVQDDAALAVLRKREMDEKLPVGTILNKGTVFVVSRTEFLADYELAPIDDPDSIAVTADGNLVDPSVAIDGSTGATNAAQVQSVDSASAE